MTRGGIVDTITWQEIIDFYDTRCKGRGPSKNGKVWNDPRVDPDEAVVVAQTLFDWRHPKTGSKAESKPEPKPERKVNRLWWQDELDLSDYPDKTEIKANFRKLVKQHHPDVGGDADKFKKLTDAYKAALYQTS